MLTKMKLHDWKFDTPSVKFLHFPLDSVVFHVHGSFIICFYNSCYIFLIIVTTMDREELAKQALKDEFTNGSITFDEYTERLVGLMVRNDLYY